MEALKNALPDHAKDLKLNLAGLARPGALEERAHFGALLAAALAGGHADVIRELHALAAEHLTPEELTAVRIAADLMAMNNVYYRSLHLVENDEYGQLPARLRMQGLAGHGAPKLDFEVWSLVVSAVNGCGMCLDSHERVLRQHGASSAVVQEAFRIAAIVNAVSASLRADQVLRAGSPAA